MEKTTKKDWNRKDSDYYHFYDSKEDIEKCLNCEKEKCNNCMYSKNWV